MTYMVAMVLMPSKVGKLKREIAEIQSNSSALDGLHSKALAAISEYQLQGRQTIVVGLVRGGADQHCLNCREHG